MDKDKKEAIKRIAIKLVLAIVILPIAVLIGFVLFWLSGLIIGYLRYAKEIPW